MAGREHKINLFSCIALVVGACIGSAIFSISGLTIHIAGPAAIVSWTLAAVIYGLYGVIVSKLAGQYPQSGGIYLFPRYALGGKAGSVLGFVSGWGYIVSNIIAVAFSAIYFSVYLQAGFPALQPYGPAIAIASLLASLAILLAGRRRSQTLQNALVILMVALIVLFCVMAFFGGGFHASAFDGFFTSGEGGAGGFLSAVPMAMVAYGGCLIVSFIASEVADPQKNIRRSLIGGLGIVVFLYVALLAAVIGTLPTGDAAQDESLRYVPLFASISLGGLVEYPWLMKVVSVCVAIALLTTIIALLRINSRAIQAMSVEGMLPRFLCRQSSRTGVALPSILVMTAICTALCFFEEWTEGMIRLGAVLGIVSMTITCISLLNARQKAVALPVLAMVLFWICYIPDIVSGSYKMWAFTAGVYLIGALTALICRKLSHPRVTGVVVHGKGHGHRHGLPTANIQLLDGEKFPKEGVWHTRVYLEGRQFEGLTNAGLRPSDDSSPVPTVETLIMDFDEDIYGKPLTLEFLSYVRPILKFPDLDALKSQIDQDIKNTFGK